MSPVTTHPSGRALWFALLLFAALLLLPALGSLAAAGTETAPASTTGDNDFQEAEEKKSSTPQEHKDIGKYLGYFSFVMLIIVSLLGSRVEPIRKFTKIFLKKESTKATVHCGVSFLILFTSLTHGLFHMIRKSTLFLDIPERFLGNVSMLFMLVVALNGIFQTELVERYGFGNWRLIHAGASLGTLFTAAIHIYYLQSYI